MKTWQTWMWILVVGAAWSFALYQGLSRSWTTHQVVGMAIAIPAFCLWALARLQLGRSFSISAQAKELVTHGLYSKIQNPVYVFGGILIAAIFILLGRPLLLLIFLVLIPMQVMRIRAERRVLEAKFGDAYREYRKRTWF
ncbi:MAG TPA: isoprenylcysteine carboxylmethyltransferase family protein [Candidatus Acidoferrales bacterium]|nr:isoprenylcysteine carboxylmethyltransferase family protein [Candidatus Acidoferrales bacterium]